MGGVVELVYTADFKSAGLHRPCGFESHRPYRKAPSFARGGLPLFSVSQSNRLSRISHEGTRLATITMPLLLDNLQWRRAYGQGRSKAK